MNVTAIGATELETIPGWNPACPQHWVVGAGEPAHVRTPRLCRYDERTADANYLAAIRAGNTHTSTNAVEQHETGTTTSHQAGPR
jgi:hypothetical protein